MGIDFDILEHCKKVRADHGPPYTCPIEKCGRTYKSVCGLQYHLKSYDHDNPTPLPPCTPSTPKSKKGRARATPATVPSAPSVPEPLTFEEAQKMVQFNVNGQVVRWNINDPLDMVAKEDLSDDDIPTSMEKIEQAQEPSAQLPEATCKELDTYNICDAPPRPNAYIRFIEKSVEELDGEVEYDVDEEDTTWLSLMNEKREAAGLSPVSVDSLELLMDRLEKESYFQASVNGHTGAVVDDDAVCCICMDGECQNTNVILFCDMCNLAVHQDCYGVPYIPEGQWLCRRCLQSPSRAVDCVLCPNQGGAFKQTDRGHWAHVVCALWIPEVRFANTVFLEPIDSIETIPAARWKLTCYVCKQRGVGACIQCHKTNCYSAFHVTCAQQAGLYMKMDTVKDTGDSQPVLVQKIAYCDVHAPVESSDDSKKEDARQKMKKARKMLAKKRTTAPVILIPTIPPERIQEIGALVTITKKSQFIQRLIAYWTLKRQFRNGVPLLRRLQSAQGGPRDSNTSNVDTIELCRQLKYWQCLRQDLERARLLCELVRKREKIKLESIKITEKCLNIQLKPLEASLRMVLDLVAAKDTNEIFSEPVDLEEVPDYTTVVSEPMDLSTMRKKLEDGLYPDLTAMEKDFDLMIANCLAYNNRDTVFYRAAIKMRDQCGAIFRQARKELEACGLLNEAKPNGEHSGSGNEESLASDIDKELESLQGKVGPDVITKLEELLVKSQALKHGLARAKRVKVVRSELNKAKKNLANTDSSQSDVENDIGDSKTSSQSSGVSPTGVNRRTAVLFTRKAQAALKKPAEEKEEKDAPSPAGAKPKKKGRPKRTTESSAGATVDSKKLDSVPDSFKVYRAGHQTSGDENSDSGTSLSTCYSHEASEVDSEDSDSDHIPENPDVVTEKVELKPLQLVWAKCRGYPWYPALIIDPEMPKGHLHKGVPIPSPPSEVMALRSNHTEHVYLVLFFDAKRTWQWLPAEKLEILGLDQERDEAKALCTETYNTDMQISEAAGGAPAPGAEPCRFPKLEECAHFHYERVQLPKLSITLQTNIDQSLHSQHTNDDDDTEWFMVQVTSGDECWLLQRNLENFKMLDDQLHQCIYDRKIFQLPDLSNQSPVDEELEMKLKAYLERFSDIADNSLNCGPVLNWLQMDNKGHRLLVPSEESRSINTPAVAAAYSVRRYVSQARDELNLEVGDMISVIDMANPGESMWWRGKRGFQVGFFPQHCVHIIGDKVPRNMPLPPPVVGSLALTPIKPVLRKHGKLITFFRSFILNRPSRRRLKQSGILKERVFGCDLGEHLLNSGHDIPMVLKCCAEFIESHGIVDGIYRLSGVTSNIQKLRNAFDEDRIPNLYTEDILQDIHSVASLLKMYFRELPNPLCTYQLYQSFVNAVQGCNSAIRNSESDHDRLLKMREAVQKLPPPHYRTLEYLMRHLAKVAKHGANTGMTTRNVAIVWAPNLLRCAELEVGGVAALQGVGVQAVVTEFLICYAHLIFCDHLPNLDLPIAETENNISPKKCRPKSLAISTPTKLITLEEARTKHLLSKNEECTYIEVGGGPKNLPKKYHTVIELPSGGRKRGHTKRSPLGWRSLFSKGRNNSQGNLAKPRKASTPGIIVADKSVTESDLTDMKRKLRSVKSAESLTSGHSEPASNEVDGLGPLYSLNKPPGHNRSVSHDSYFDTLQNSQNNSEGSLLDLSEIQLNFELEESEMRIFSEDESLVSSPRIQKDSHRRILTRARPEEFSSATNSGNPSPKKQARVVLSPDSMSRKRTRLEDQLSDIQYIDCTTPENMAVTTLAVVHSTQTQEENVPDSYQPKNKSPRNSDNLDKRQSLNLEREVGKQGISKSFTEVDIGRTFLDASSLVATPTPQSPVYRRLESAATTPDYSPTEIVYQNLNNSNDKKSGHYENILTTISITYKSPPRSVEASPVKSNADAVYENVIVNVEKAMVPTSTASLPSQEATQPDNEFLSEPTDNRPKSLSALDESSNDLTLKPNLSSSAICDTSEQISLVSFTDPSSNQSSRSNVQYTPSLSSGVYQMMENSERISPTDLSLSEVIHSSTENLSQSSASFPLSYSKNSSPNVSPSPFYEEGSEMKNDNGGEEEEKSEDLIEFSPTEEDVSRMSLDKRKSSETETMDDNSIYQQVKFFRRSIHEVNALLELNEEKKGEENEENYDSLEVDSAHVYENLQGEEMKNDVNNEEEVKNEEDTKTETKNEEVDGKVCVKDLTSRFENAQNETKDVTIPRMKKSYEKDGLPPCLRARNLKNQLKTRSLDEEEFKKEFGGGAAQRRKSMDEGMGFKTNSLPKTLNPPKVIPMDEEGKLSSIHLAHSTENLDLTSEEEMKKRERIEKYKEERRKYLHDKYRSESFKEDKDVLLSKLKIFKNRDERPVAEDTECEVRSRRKGSRSDDSAIDSLDEEKGTCNKRSDLKSRAAVFEQANQRLTTDFNKNNKTQNKVQECKSNFEKDDFVRKKDEDLQKYEKRRHTFESRDRESETERLRRISLESRSPRKEKSSPSYCIKDMKAIFESKSKQ